MKIRKKILQYESEMIQQRRYLHQHPELSCEETQTKEYIKKELEKLSLTVIEIENSNGLVAWINPEKKNKKIALRADFDALPITEENECSFRSTAVGKMHACGHDGHVAMLLNAARVLVEYKDELNGSVCLCFQHGEERGFGAKEIIEYLESEGGVDRVGALHLWAEIPSGTILLRDGATMAGACGFRVVVKGKGGHASRPDLSHDPIRAACDILLKVSAIPSNQYDFWDNCAVHIGKIAGGTLGNIFPDEAELRGGMRFFKRGGKEKIMKVIEQITKGVCMAYGVEAEITRDNAGIEPMMNDIAAVNEARLVANQIEGLIVDSTRDPISASDNYTYFLEKYPGFYGFLGIYNPEKNIIYPQHTSRFDLDEDVLKLGSEFLVRYALSALQS